MKRFMKMLILSAMLVLSLGCITTSASAAAKTSVMALKKGKTSTIKNTSKVTSSKKKVAAAKKKTSTKYKITAKKAGKTTLKVYNKKGKLTQKIYLLVYTNKTMNYDTSAISLKKGSTKKVQATVPSGCTVKYASSDKSIAKVNSKGKITAVKKGTATIKAKVYYKGTKIKTYKKDVTVKSASGSSSSSKNYSWDTSALTVSPNVMVDIAATLSSEYTAEYSSSNSSVVRVTSRGLICGEKAGTATITCKIYNNGVLEKTMTKKITVRDYKLSSSSLSLILKDTTTLTCSADGSYDSSDYFNWTSSDTSVAKITQLEGSENSVTIKGIGTGTATISCGINYCIYLTCKVTVKLDTVTANGVSFDMTDYPKTLSVDSSMGCLSVNPLSSINPADITYVVANGKAELLCDYTNPDLYANKTQQYTYQYYVSDWKNMIAYIDISYQPDMYLKYRCEIYSQLKTGSFPVSVYYQGKLLRTFNVTVTETYENAENWRVWVDEIESKAWKSGMSVEEKLAAIESYVPNHYSYYEDGVYCNDGAAILLFAARDLGLTARYRFTHDSTTGSNYNYGISGQDVYYHLGMAFIAGHVCTVITIDGTDYIYQTQGQL